VSPVLHEVIYLPKMTKAQARRRLTEASTKVSKVFIDADVHLTNADLGHLLKIRNQLNNMAKKLK